MAPFATSARIWPPLAVTFLLLSSWAAILAIPGASLIVILCLLRVTAGHLLIGAGVLAAVLILLFWWRHWISGVTMAAGLVMTFLLTNEPTPATSAARWLANLTHVVYYRSALLRQAAELRSKGVSPTVAAIGIEGFGSLTDGIAFDPTGEIVLAPDKRSKAWTEAAALTELSAEGMEADHIVGDYYSWFHY